MTNGNLTVSGTNTSLNTQNATIDTNTIGTLAISNPIALAIDASLSNPSADTISASSITAGAESIIISAINLITGTTAETVDIQLTTNNTLKTAYKLSDDILENITNADGVEYYVTSASYNNSTGVLTLNGSQSSPDIINETTQSNDICVTIPDYLNIEEASKVASATASILNGTTLSLDVSPSVSYNVYANYNAKVYVSATAQTGQNSHKALYGSDLDDMTIVFTNTNGNATSTNIENCTSASPNTNDNANAIAFKLTCAESTASDTASPTIKTSNGVIEYDLDSGTTTLSFSVGTTSQSGTFHTNDPAGTYQATIVISNVAP